MIKSISEKNYEFILGLDRKIYPTAEPVSKETIKKWYIRNPEFGMIFEDGNKISGVSVAIPLNKKGWNPLINGTLKESELNESTIFDNSRDKEMGIHIYHVERFNGTKEFFLRVLGALDEAIKKLKSTNKGLKIIGLSGLCVSIEGINLFEHKFNCKERNFISSEYILEKDGQKFALVLSKSEFQEKISSGYKLITRTKMLVLYPSEKSIVWGYLK